MTNKPPLCNKPPPPAPLDRLCQLITNVKLGVDWRPGMVYSPTGSLEFFYPRLRDLQLLVLEFSTVYFSSLWRADTNAFAKLSMSPISIKHPPTPLLKCVWNNQSHAGLNRGFTVIPLIISRQAPLAVYFSLNFSSLVRKREKQRTCCVRCPLWDNSS